MPLKRDSCGSIESLPLKLIIISIVMVITIPVAWTGLSNYSKIQAENNMRSQVEYIATTAKQVYAGANGTSLSIKVNFEGGFFNNVEYVKIGDSLSSGKCSTIRYKISGETEKTYVIQNPNVPMTSTDGDALQLGSGTYTLILEHKIDDGENYIEVRLTN